MPDLPFDDQLLTTTHLDTPLVHLNPPTPSGIEVEILSKMEAEEVRKPTE
jgi:hypothetical protein